MIKFNKYISIILIVLFCIIIISKLYKPVKNNNLVKGKGQNSNKSDINNELRNYQDFNLPQENIIITFEGKPIQLKSPIYNDKNRLYIPLYELVKSINGSITFMDKVINISINNKNIIINTDKKYWLDGNTNTTLNLKKNIIINNHNIYVSLFDLTTMLDLKTRWNIDKKQVHLFWNKERIVPLIKNQSSSKYALIRLEDITAAQRYETAEQLEKLRVVADYLYSSGVPFHIAWVPRYIDKVKAIDNDPSKIYNIYNADFIFTMDYLINKNGLIGIHGYTHQFKDSVSIDGVEFSKKYNTEEKSIRGRLQLAIKCAEDLDFKYSFFETPHYEATDFQHKIMEEYFKYIYDPNINSKGRYISAIYVPTPLNYVDGKEDLNNMLKKIGNLKQNELGSFFYHPNIEFEFIKIDGNNDEYPTYKYDENSVLHQILNAFDKKGYKFISILNLK